MIAVDSSSFIAFMENEIAPDCDAIWLALEREELWFPQHVVSELFSDYTLPRHHVMLIMQAPKLEIAVGYFRRAGEMRAALLKQKKKARMVDALIAQSCIDSDVSLITRDVDFRHYLPHGLRLAA